MQISLVKLQRRWNVKRKSMCCPYHAMIFTTRECLRLLERKHCCPTFCPRGSAQCQACGVLTDVDDESQGDSLDVPLFICDVCLVGEVKLHQQPVDATMVA